MLQLFWYFAVPHGAGPETVSALTENCIASGEELYQAFLRRGIKPNTRYQFDVHYPELDYYKKFTTFTVVYNTRILKEDANDNANLTREVPDFPPDRCCEVNTSDSDCFVVQAARQFVYRVIPSPLVYMLALPWLTPFALAHGNYVLPDFIRSSNFIGCWNMPPICARHQYSHAILRDFTSIWVGYVLCILHNITHIVHNMYMHMYCNALNLKPCHCCDFDRSIEFLLLKMDCKSCKQQMPKYGWKGKAMKIHGLALC